MFNEIAGLPAHPLLVHAAGVQEQTMAPELLDRIDAHAASARTLLLLTLALGAASFASILLEPRLRSTAPAVALAALTCTIGAAVLWSVVATGHTGTAMVWE